MEQQQVERHSLDLLHLLEAQPQLRPRMHQGHLLIKVRLVHPLLQAVLDLPLPEAVQGLHRLAVVAEDHLHEVRQGL